jgi:hypothetical protein
MSETRRRLNMNVGSIRRAAPWVVVLMTVGAAGCACTSPTATKLSQCPVKNKEHIILLRAEKQPNGHYKAIAHPDHITILGYNPENPDTVVIWPYHHFSTRIEFAQSTGIKPPDCPAGSHECTLILPKGLPLRTPLKYTVTGKYDPNTDLDPNDPDIEVDR